MKNSILIAVLFTYVGFANTLFAQNDGSHIYKLTDQSVSNFSTTPRVSSITSPVPSNTSPAFSNTSPAPCSDCSAGMETIGTTNGYFEQTDAPATRRWTLGRRKARSDANRYITLFGGWNLLEDHNGDVDQARFSDGFILGFAKGRFLSNNRRIELESSWANSTGSRTTQRIGFDGHINNFSTMVNLYKDITPDSLFGLYVGGGIGFSRQDAEFISSGVELEIEDYAFAYQGIVGVNYRVTGHGSDLYVEYRYQGNTETDIDLESGGFHDTFDYDAQNIVFGIRIKR